MQCYFLPLAIDWETRDHDPAQQYGAWALAKVRRRERVGLLYGAFGNPQFARALASAMSRNAEMAVPGGTLQFSSTKIYEQFAESLASDDVRIPTLEQSNTGVFFGNRLFLKGYRRMRQGINPELEVGRFLTEVSPYPNIAPLVGAAEFREDGAGEPATLAVLQKFVENQGDLWSLIHEHLTRKLDTPPPPGKAAPPGADTIAADFHLARMGLLGRRVAELHRALCVTTGDPAFDPEPFMLRDFEGWKDNVEAEIDATFMLVRNSQSSLSPEARAQVETLLETKDRLHERVRGLACQFEGLVKTRYHGDLHLGQVLVAQDDFVIVDFEGEPGRALAERRAKSSVLRDVAGMLRSFSYAAHSAILRRGAGVPAAGAGALIEWERDASRHFLEGYSRAAAGLASVPADAASFKATLELFLLEKALYEMRYEIANRPDWMEIPLRGLMEIAKT
jgi:maltose alpha-D-glucosyltransferase/alpha-amylase